MKIILDSGKVHTPDEKAFGMTRYAVFDGESIIDSGNDLIELAKRHGIEPIAESLLKTQKK
tara:strand:- start:66 stop:248 length:183 start_codon:yes stop_codon:yes gene_type:complete